MKSLLFLSAFAASVNGLVGRAEPACCFHLNVTGEVTGPLGQLVDGQSRVGDHSLPQSQFCINSTGVITDATGKGCIITTETTQFQCDEGKPGTPGFSISASGQLQFHGSSFFIACETGQNGGMNIYTTNSTSVTRCKAVVLNADTCISTGNIPVAPIPPAPGGGALPAGPGGPGGSVSVSVSTFISTVTVSNCVCPITAAPGAPGAPAPAPAPAPVSSATGPAAPPVSLQTSSAPAATAPAPILPVAPAPHTSAASETTAAPTSAGSAAPPSGTTHTSAAPVAPVPVQPTTAPEEETHPSSAASSIHTSSVCPSCASASSSSAQSSATSPCPSCSKSATSSAQPSATTPCPACQSASITKAHPSSPCPSCTSQTPVPPFLNSTRISSIPVTTSPSSVRPSSTIHVNSTSTAATSTKTSATNCPTDLSGSFEFPHLMVRIDSAKPDTTHGTGLNGTINSTVSTTFNFDIPSSLSGRTCSLVFFFPRKEDLVTTSFSFTGDGKIAVGKLSQTVSSSTTFNNVPSVSQGLGVITISPGNSFVISTFSCPAGQAVTFEMRNAGSTDLEFFEDFNPPPLGLFITTC